MIEHVIILSLIITAIHVCTWDGMILHSAAERVGGWLDRKGTSILRKPLFECLICMGGIYTIVLYPLLFGWSWNIVPTMLCVIGLNTIISAVTCRLNE